MDKKIRFKENFLEIWSLIKGKKFLFFSLFFIVIALSSLSILPKFLFKYLVDYATELSSGLISLETFASLSLFLLAIYVGYALFQVIFSWLRTDFIIKLQLHVIQRLKKRYYSHIIKLDHKFHANNKTGTLISRLTRGSGALENLIDILIFQIFPPLIQVIIIIGSIWFMNKISSIIVLLVCISFVTYSIWISKLWKKDRQKENNTIDLQNAKIADNFTNIETIKYFGKENLVLKNFCKFIDKLKKIQLKSWNWWRLQDSGSDFIISSGTIIVLIFSVKGYMQGTVTLGELSFIYTAYLSLIGSLHHFTWGIKGYFRTMVDVQDLFNYKRFKNKIKDLPNAKELEIQNGEVEFSNLTFSYDDKNKLFEKFNLKIPSGKTVALVGHSGCGKSSLIKLLYRLYDLKNGKILIDGKNIKEFNQESLRSEMSIVPQEPILFDDTIFNNIKFVKPNATRREVFEAMKFAQLDGFVSKLSKKENTIVGERGIKLSGGQKQRVSIARAILANKKILILDEATSALDSRTEKQIQNDLLKLLKGRTSIVIAHRLSTVMSADVIVVLKEGKIIEKGNHEQLIKKQGEYYSLWKLQKDGFLSDWFVTSKRQQKQKL